MQFSAHLAFECKGLATVNNCKEEPGEEKSQTIGESMVMPVLTKLHSERERTALVLHVFI